MASDSCTNIWIVCLLHFAMWIMPSSQPPWVHNAFVLLYLFLVPCSSTVSLRKHLSAANSSTITRRAIVLSLVRLTMGSRATKLQQAHKIWQSIPFRDRKIFHYFTDVPSMLLHTAIIYYRPTNSLQFGRSVAPSIVRLLHSQQMFPTATCNAVNK